MKLKIHELTEEIIGFSEILQKNLKHYFNNSTYCFVNFNIDGKSDISLIQVFYSEETGFFSAKHQDKNVIKYAFGKYDRLKFHLAKEKYNPVDPLFVFDFPLDYSEKKYGAVFANINTQLHILSKVYKLSEKDIEILNSSYNVYPIEGKDYALFDFGSIKHPEKFLKHLEETVDVLEFLLSPNDKLFIKPYSIKSITKSDSVNSDYKYCMVCGHKLESTINLNLLEFYRKFPARCESCLEKIYALDLYYELDKHITSSKMVYLSDLTNLWYEEDLLGYNMKLLSKFEFLNHFHDEIYKLQANEDIIRLFSPLLNPIEETEEDDEDDEELLRLLGLDDDEKKCKYCGKILNEEDGKDICSVCLHKQNAIPQIHKLLRYVKPGTAFTKSSIINKGLKSYDLDIICSYLVDLELLRDDMDDLLILESKSVLNEFIRKYSDDEEDLIADNVKEVEKIKIKNSQLNEYAIDKVINLIDFIDFVEVTFVREFYEWEVLYKKDGEDYFQVYDNPFEAKLAAIKYLEKLGIVEIIREDIQPIPEPQHIEEKMDEPKEPPVPKVKECVICGTEFAPKCSNGSDKYCEECKSKYSPDEKIVLVLIKEGSITKETAIKIVKLQKDGKNNIEIAKILKLPKPSLIKHIVRILLPDALPVDEEDYKHKTNTCVLCEEKFVPNSSSGSDKFCQKCKSKYNTTEIYVLLGVKEGKYTKELADKFVELQKEGKYNYEIEKLLNIKPGLINPIIKYFENETSEVEDLHKHLFESNGNIILKGIITADDYSDFFSFISLIDCDLNQLTCKKLKNKNYELYSDFNLKDKDIPLNIRKLESLGWKKK